MNNTTSSVRCPKCGRVLPAEASEGICPACALAAIATPTEAGQPARARPAPPPLETVAAVFSQLEIVELIGVGGMGAVYKARQPKLDRFVALKLLERPLAREGTFAERFRREARLLARLNHPGIVSVYDYGEAGGFFYLLMEYVDGVNLRQAMRAGRFTPEQALTLVPKICEALQYAHDEGILHRDIKPENILLDMRGRVKIADFGIAKLVDARNEGAALTASGLAVGTPHYMAPEQLEHPQDVDQRADIYSLGVVFYELLTGELPIGRFAPPSRKTPVDPRVDQVVLRALEKERERRQRNVTEVKEQVETIATSPASPATASAAEPDPAWMRHEPKVSFCLVSTPEYLRSFRGRFLNICQGKGELRLQGGTLTFQSGWQAVFIPLRSIRVLARGDYPASAKPVPLSYLGVTYEEHGHARTLLFTPMLVALAPPWETNALVAEWAAAVQQAVRQATGQQLEIEVSNAAENWSWVELAKTYLLTAAGGTAAFALIPLIAERRLPNRLSELVWGPITAALTLGLLLAARWWRRRLNLAAARTTELRPWERSWLRLPEPLRRALRTGLLLASAVLALFFLSFSATGRTEKGWASSEWSVGAFDPWLQKWAHFPRSGFLFGIEVNLASSSFACGIGALLLGVLGLAASRIEAIGRNVAPPPGGGHGVDSAGAPTKPARARVTPPVNPVRNQPGGPADSPGLHAKLPCDAATSTPLRARNR